MNKKILCLIIPIILPIICEGQKIVKNENDKFLKVNIIETSWEPIKVQFVNALRFRIQSIDGKKRIEFMPTFHSVYRVDEGDLVYLLFDNDLSISLKCIRGGVANPNTYKGSTYWNGHFLYELSSEAEDAISKYDLVAVRISLGDEYYVFDDVKSKNAGKLRQALMLVSNSPTK